MTDAIYERVIAFEHGLDGSYDSIVQSNVQKILDCRADARVVVFTTSQSHPQWDGVECIEVPDSKATSAKLKNFIIDWTESNVKRAFLHIVEESTEILKDPSEYILKLENTMQVLEYKSRFSTVTDPCNYVFNKFNPRVQIDFDCRMPFSGLPESVSFTSHANTAWLTFIVDTETEKVQRFNESFTIMMYVIIEYLAKRRASRRDGQLYYMNQYLSISDEVGVMRCINNDSKIDQQAMARESEVFNALKLDTTPDNNVDQVLESMYNMLKADEEEKQDVK